MKACAASETAVDTRMKNQSLIMVPACPHHEYADATISLLFSLC